MNTRTMSHTSDPQLAAEAWLPVVGWEKHYEVSSLGRVRSLKGPTSRLMKPSPLRGGHLRLNLSDRPRLKSFLVHRLVLTAFVGPCPDGMEGCHTDGDPTNNRLENLRWDTRSGNVQDAIRHGTHSAVRKTHCPQGHPLSEPNLRVSLYRRGNRHCLACSQEQGSARRQHRPFSQEKSDARYEMIIEKAADRHGVIRESGLTRPSRMGRAATVWELAVTADEARAIVNAS